MIEGTPSRRRANDRSPTENALRYIGSQRSGQLVELLRTAVEWPSGDVGVALRSLTEPTAVLSGWTADERAVALQRLVESGIDHPSVGPGEHSRERRVLRAAFRLPDPEIDGRWASTLNGRWEQLRALEHVFPKATTHTVQPMEAAWTRAVRKLGEYLDRRFEQLVSADDWQELRGSVESRSVPTHVDASDEVDLSQFRPASKGAQPFFVNLFVTTVFFKGRANFRRITERVVTAQRDGVEFYVARTYSGDRTFNRKYVPVRALWGCVTEPVPVTSPGDPVMTRLRFPHPLRRGEQAYFASEALFDAEPSAADERDWIDVDIDHHGTVRGELHHGGLVPRSGLTIRVCFDPSFVPLAAWWYAEGTELERGLQPPPGDERLLQIVGGQLSHTFTQICQPRESYGIGFHWGPA